MKTNHGVIMGAVNLPPPAKLVGDLRKKVEIMANRWRDFLRLYRPFSR